MKKHGRLLTAFGFLLAGVFVLAAPAFAQSVDDKIKSLEQELSQLKDQQIEMKKEATAAAAALPSFEYRPGNGLNIEAADKAWGLRFTIETHFRYEFESGRSHIGRTEGELMGRRFRPGVLYCINNCLWEIEATLDLDGFGTGNGKNSTNTSTSSILQRGAVNFHAENLNPWLPTVQFGMDIQNAGGGSLARQGSGSVGAQAEYDLLTRNNGFNTGRAGQGMVLNWDDRSLSGIGIPGRIGKFQVGMSSIGEGDDGLSSFKDKKSFNEYLSIQPFSEVKNKWISGLTFEYGVWFCNVDLRGMNGCDRYRIQDHGDGGRQTLFDTGAGSIGNGLTTAMGPGVVWSVGPYTLRAMGSFEQSADEGGTRGKKRAHNFLIGHDLYLWSPKGFLTGSATTPNSILVGTHFERNDMSVDCSNRPGGGSSGILCANTGIGGHITQFHRNTILLREWDLWYVIAPRMNVGLNVLWYDAANLRNGANQAAQNLGICTASTKSINSSNCRPGIGGDWVDVFLNWRYTF
ncbi:MAG: hypothetical protein E6J74_14120 [Deltaproteobacteria bacterium]|nr:MAG: hypothetical protein E6J74_14120 [Deltaproteobacteria bacterium]